MKKVLMLALVVFLVVTLSGCIAIFEGLLGGDDPGDDGADGETDQTPSVVEITAIEITEHYGYEYLQVRFRNDGEVTVTAIRFYAEIFDAFGDLDPGLSSDYFLGYYDGDPIPPGEVSAIGLEWALTWHSTAYSVGEHGVFEIAFEDGGSWEDATFTP